MKRKMYAVVGAVMLSGLMAMSASALTQDEVLGTWYLTTIISEGMELDAATFGAEMDLEFREDGVAAMTYSGVTDENSVWEIDGETVVVTDAEDEEVEPTYITIEDGMLVMADDEDTMIFGREKPVAEEFDVGTVIEAPALEDFNGTWNATMISMFGMDVPMAVMGMELTIEITDGNAAVIFVDDEGETTEKELVGELDGDTLLLTNPDDPGDFEIYFDTDTMNLRLHDNGIMSYSDRDFTEVETEAPEVEEDETEELDIDTSFAVFFEKQ